MDRTYVPLEQLSVQCASPLSRRKASHESRMYGDGPRGQGKVFIFPCKVVRPLRPGLSGRRNAAGPASVFQTNLGRTDLISSSPGIPTAGRGNAAFGVKAVSVSLPNRTIKVVDFSAHWAETQETRWLPRAMDEKAEAAGSSVPACPIFAATQNDLNA